MNLTIKYIIRIILIIVSLLLITTIIIKTLFGEKIENTVINQINNQLNSELSLKEIDFSLLTQFPYASVDIDDLFVVETEGFNNDTLLYSKKTYVKLSIYDLIFNEIDIKQARERLAKNSKAILIDVREDNEWENGHTIEAVHLSKGILERDIESVVPEKNTEIIMYCGGGYRSVLTAEISQKMGYTNVHSLIGGFKALLDADWKMEPKD